jgi:3-oxoadipate enol-lactonase
VRGVVRGIAWEDRGDPGAMPILLVRPMGGSMSLWGEFGDALARDLRVITFDALGSGASCGRARTSTSALADDARAVLDARSIQRTHVFGISLGGMVATRLAIASPARMASLVLASTATRGLAFERAGAMRALGFARCLARSPSDAERCIVRRVLSRKFRTEHPDLTEQIADLAARAPSPRATIAAHALAAIRHDARAELGRIRAPTLILSGDHDHLLGPDAGPALARGIHESKRALVEGAGHDLTLERPRETATRVLEFAHA